MFSAAKVQQFNNMNKLSMLKDVKRLNILSFFCIVFNIQSNKKSPKPQANKGRKKRHYQIASNIKGYRNTCKHTQEKASIKSRFNNAK